MTVEDVRHCTEALAEYAAGAQPGPAQAAVEAHLARCPSCRADLAGWTTVAAATVEPLQAPPDPVRTVRSALIRSALRPAAMGPSEGRCRWCRRWSTRSPRRRSPPRAASPTVGD